MRVIGLIVPILLVPLGLGAQVPYGVPVTAIAIEGAPESVLEFLPIEPGDTLTPEAVRSAFQYLYQTGSYGQIELAAAAEANGTRLTFSVTPPYFFATIRVRPERLLERPLSSYTALPYGERFSRNALDRIVDSLREQFEAEGYFETRIAGSWEFDEETRLATVTFDVEAGPRSRLGVVTFGGTQQTFFEDELIDAFDFRPGDRFLRARLRQGGDRIRSRFTELGFLTASVQIVESYDPGRTAVDLSVTVDSGSFVYVLPIGYDLSDEEIRELIPVYDEGSVDADLIEEGRLAFLDHLHREGYLDASIASEVIEVPEDNAYQINYTVELGERYSVREVLIEGNSFFSDEVLYERIGISPHGLFDRGVFSPALLDEARETIRRLYEASGFSDTEVTAPNPVRIVGQQTAENEIAVVISIDEGRRLIVGNVYFSSDSETDEADLAQVAGVFPDQFYTGNLLQAGRRALTSAYHRQGYSEVRVDSSVELIGDDRVDITYQITEGESSQIGRIFVSGNTLTQEKIVHRNSALVEGAPYDPESILEAQQQLYATGLFNRVDIVPLERPLAGRPDLLIQLEDAGPIVLTYGIGAQDREGVRGTVEVSHSNLWGLDRSISLRMRGSKREQRFQTTYREPRLFNWELDGYASLFVERTSQRAFDASRVDFSFQSLKEFANEDRLLMSASYQTVNLRDIRDNRLVDEFPEEEGIIQIARLSASYVRDTRDDILNPTRGNYFTGTLQLANKGLGSEVNFTNLYTQFSIYRPANAAVLAASARFGWIQPYGRTDPPPITERYFAGGSTTLRGFGLDEAGITSGGHALAILNAEYRFPIPFPISGFGGTVFYDTGTVYNDLSDFKIGDFTHSAGFGFRYQTPIGPIRVDFGVNLNRQPEESKHQISFTLGHAF